jgi:hypothetical protein
MNRSRFFFFGDRVWGVAKNSWRINSSGCCVRDWKRYPFAAQRSGAVKDKAESPATGNAQLIINYQLPIVNY